MSKLSEALAAPPRPVNACKVCSFLEGHPDRKAIDAAMADARWGHATLARVLTDNDVPVGETSVKNHRHRCLRPKAGK